MVSLKNRALVNQVRNYGDRASDLEQQLADRIEHLELELQDAAKHLDDMRQARDDLIASVRLQFDWLRTAGFYWTMRILKEACERAEKAPWAQKDG